MGSNNNKGFAQTIGEIFNVLFLGTGILLFVPTGALLAVAMIWAYADNLAKLALYILGVVSFTTLISITALVPSRFFSMLGMAIAVFALTTFGVKTVIMALSQMPPVFGFAGMLTMSIALTLTHMALWQAVRNLMKVEPIPAKTPAPASNLAGTALSNKKP